jgi:hypothetical protein
MAGMAATQQKRTLQAQALPVAFEPNRGQAPADVAFVARASQYTLYLSAGQARYVLVHHPAPSIAPLPVDYAPGAAPTVLPGQWRPPAQVPLPTPVANAFDTLTVQFAGAGSAAPSGGTATLPGSPGYPSGEDALLGTVNYLSGQAHDTWIEGVPTFGRVRYQDLYPGVDLEYYGQAGQVQGDYVVQPGADPGVIQQRIVGSAGGVGNVALDGQGALEFTIAGAALREASPSVYQEVDGQRRTVQASFVLRTILQPAAWVVQFTIGRYDHHLPLVIDPELAYATYLAGTGFNQGQGVAVDSQGNAYVVGGASAGFPGSALPGQNGPGQYAMMPFCTKLDPNGNIVYSTVFGDPNDSDSYASAVALDNAGQAYLTGYTRSMVFPTTADALYPQALGHGQAFVVVLNPAGNQMVYGSYLGQADYTFNKDDTWGQAIAVPPGGGTAYVVGETEGPSYLSSGIPSVPGGSNTNSHGQFGGAFLTVLSTTARGWYGGGMLGTGPLSWANGIAVDSSGNMVIAGYAQNGAFSPTYSLQGASATYGAFVARLHADFSRWDYADFLGGNGSTEATAVALDSSGNAYVTGWTQASNYPIWGGAYSYERGSADAFVTEIQPNGYGTVFSTVLDGSGTSAATAIALDSEGNIAIAGQTSSADFPAAGPIQAGYGGGSSDAFIAELSKGGGSLLFSSLLGGSDGDAANAVAVDTTGAIIVAGTTYSPDFPTMNALQPYASGASNAFVARISLSSSTSTVTAKPGDPITGINWPNLGQYYEMLDWDYSDDNLPDVLYQDNNPNDTISVDTEVDGNGTNSAGQSVCAYQNVTYGGQPNTQCTIPWLTSLGTHTITMLAYAGSPGSKPHLVYDKPFLTVNVIPPDASSFGSMAQGAVGAPAAQTVGTVADTSTPSAYQSADDQLAPYDAERTHAAIGADGHVHLELYPGPVGYRDPATRQWGYRTPQVSQTAGAFQVSTANLPFQLTIAATTAVTAQAQLTNEDGATLGIALSGVAGQPLQPVSGQLQGGQVTYDGASAVGPGDLTLRPTVGGVDLHLTLHAPLANGQVALMLSPGGTSEVTRDPDGTVFVRTPTQTCGSTGCDTTYAPEFVLEQPLLRDGGSDPAAAVQSGGVTLAAPQAATCDGDSSCSGGQPGAQQVTLTLDSAWLNDPARTYPVTLDIPFATATSAAPTELFGTVQSCAPAQPAPLGAVVVGSERGCQYEGKLQLIPSSPLLQQPIQSAVLRLYTPNQTGMTGVQVYPNALLPALLPPAGWATPAAGPTAMAAGTPSATPVGRLDLAQPLPPSWDPPSWNGAVPIAPDSTGSAQSASDGHWQSWDITAILQQWLQGGRHDSGLTLAGTGSPVLFASAGAVGDDGADLAPVIDVTLGTTAQAVPGILPGAQATAGGTSGVSPQMSWLGATTPYGIAGGGHVPQGTCKFSWMGLPTDYPGCTQYPDGIHPAFDIEWSMENSQGNGYYPGLGASYIRGGGVSIPCNRDTSGVPGTASNSDPTVWQPAYTFMAQAYGAGLIPVVDIGNPPAGCTDPSVDSNADWGLALAWFAFYLPSFATVPDPTGKTIDNPFGSNPPMYFELGNEIPHNFGSGYAADTYPDEFARASQMLQYYLGQPGLWSRPTYTNYRIVTDGVDSPATTSNGATNLDWTMWAVSLANTQDWLYQYAACDQYLPVALGNRGGCFVDNGSAVPATRLAVAVHPYGYDTSDPNGWRNYYTPLGNKYAGPSMDLGVLVTNWELYLGDQGLPIFFSEDNFTPTATNQGTKSDAMNEAAYLADLFTWLTWHCGANGNQQKCGSNSDYPIVVLWYGALTGPDKGKDPPDLGIYGWPASSGKAPSTFKDVQLQGKDPQNPKSYNPCPNYQELGYPNWTTLDEVYRDLAQPGHTCYPW